MELIEIKIKEIFVRVAKIEISTSNENWDFSKQLGIDSLTKVRLIIEIENAFDLDLDPGKLSGLNTFKLLKSFIELQLLIKPETKQ